ncbi:cobalt-zinc-cadmium efflux system membrane fusion protein [Rhabdobacter roseus]|uniref:Cobalt-zinc-cadmium efflux system membrane fusion protein n=1 Tax=Rhabdobacter roseus TaxID=1655419 RepID=A0A840TQG4_9BACT|nr:efflux RND transporter periplasmic adaptor subunit [Rhabdobacter roseus]MBB5281989.1 cobalt-zinc-cadmium efflux system membrane fusion protein [Rhabdobacter roseus]
MKIKNASLVLSLLIIGAACKPEETQEVPKEKKAYCLPASLKEKIKMDTVALAPVTESRRLSGKVDYHPDRVLHYVSLVGGVITKTHFTLGDQVKKGQVLAEIRSVELSALESERKSLESRLTVALRSVQAAQSMFEDGIASEKSLLEAKSEESVLRAELEKTTANLALFSASEQRDVFLIKAPASGFIVNKNITDGMQIAAESEPLFTISDLSQVWVSANVYASDLEFVKEKMSVSLQATAYPGEVFQGTIQALSQVFDTEEKVLKARIVMDNSALKLKPGMFIEVVAQKQTGTQALRVPQKALIFSNNKNYLLVYHSDCALEAREVETLSRSHQDIFLTGGIRHGEKIITKNQLLIFEELQNAIK